MRLKGVRREGSPFSAKWTATPAGYPFHGNKTSIARQIGNALPAPLIEAVVRANTMTTHR